MSPVALRKRRSWQPNPVAGHNGGRSHRLKYGSHETDAKPVAVPTMPPLSGGWLDLDPAEARRLKVWGERIIDDIKAFRHRERRRREGRRGVSA